jgi:leucyl-tRNA synthetase
MAVPAHDERDFEFAKKFDLLVMRVVKGGELPYAGEGELQHSGKFSGMSSEKAREEIIREVGGTGLSRVSATGVLPYPLSTARSVACSRFQRKIFP